MILYMLLRSIWVPDPKDVTSWISRHRGTDFAKLESSKAGKVAVPTMAALGPSCRLIRVLFVRFFCFHFKSCCLSCSGVTEL